MSKSLRSLSRDEIVAGSREPFHREHELLTPLIPFATLYKDTFATKLANIFLDNLVHPDEAALP